MSTHPLDRTTDAPGDALGDVLARENARLAAHDLTGAAALLAEKQAAMAAFLAQSPRSGGRDALGRLAALAADNRTLLERALVVQTRVLGTIARAVPRAWAQQAGGYGHTGRVRAASTIPAVALSACA